jgi:hypothetical protein
MVEKRGHKQIMEKKRVCMLYFFTCMQTHRSMVALETLRCYARYSFKVAVL